MSRQATGVSQPAKILLVACGTLFVILGLVGIFVPLLPTTPFLLLAAACYARSSARLYRWLLNNRWFGEYIRNYREGRGLPLRLKILTIISLWLVIGFTAVFAASAWWLRVVLFVIMAGVTVHIATIKTSPGRKASPPPEEAPPG